MDVRFFVMFGRGKLQIKIVCYNKTPYTPLFFL